MRIFEPYLNFFPEAVAEGKVNFDILRQLLCDSGEVEQERYSFTWNGKNDALRLSQTPSLGTLRPCKKESKNWDTTQNLYIEGDNLEVLKLLQKSYYGKVKMIYIDPPYNTGNDFVYKDDFKDSIDNYKHITGQIDGNGHNIATNTESNGRFHTDWLNMIYPRLRLARNLLTEDGVIFISIDDHEQANLKKVCDEIFGEINFVENYFWESTFRPDNSSSLFRRNAEHILCYAKQKSSIEYFKGVKSKTEGMPSLTKAKEKRKQITFPANVVKTFLPDGIYKKGMKDNGKNPQWELIEDIEVKDGIIITEVILEGHSYWATQEKIISELQNGTEIWIKSESFVPYYKKSKESIARPTKLLDKEIAKDYLYANVEIENVFSRKVFNNPKPTTLISFLCDFLDDRDAIVLDFFSGSATTAHAVMQLNVEDGGSRKFIMVQLPEVTPEDSEAAKAGYENICEIGKERIRRAGEKIKAEAGDKTPDLDIGFKVFKLDSSNFKKWNPQTEDVMQSLLESVDNFLPGRTDLDVVYEILLKMGIELSTEIEEREVMGEKIYILADGSLMICLGENIMLNIVDEMVKIHKEYGSKLWQVVFHDVGFASDMDKTNIKETLKTAGLKEDNFVCV
mgnify:CR=1 FL=1